MTDDRPPPQDAAYHFECGEGFPQAGHQVTENFASQRGHFPPVLKVSNGMPHPSGPHAQRIPGVYVHAHSGQRMAVIASCSTRAESNPVRRSRPVGARR